MKYIILILLLGCSNMQSLNTEKAHHTKDGFKNLDPKMEHKSLSDVLGWQFGRLFKNLPSLDAKDYSIETFTNDGLKLNENQKNFSFTWIGHASVLIQLEGKNILTDPIWSERCSPVSFAGPKRYTNPGIKIENLPKIDLVLISHNHYDHLDLPTLKILNEKFRPKFFVGLKNKPFLEENGIQNIVELDWWDETESNELKIIFTPTQHFSARGVFDRNQTLWGSFVVQGKKNSFYFAGDTGYFSGFQEIGKKFPNLDVAILPIGAYEPRWFMKPVHMNPSEAMDAYIDLKAKYFLPMHYLTFVLTDEALDEPLKLTKLEFENKGISSKNLFDLKIGESKFFP
jgi:N-acyl-phosphatidylethanolamine-hydrolysing phospholipase D